MDTPESQTYKAFWQSWHTSHVGRFMQASIPLPDLKDSKARRQTMVDCQIRTFEVTDQRLIDRFLEVPRERFVPDADRELAYSDIAFTFPTTGGEMRYVLPPLVLARLIQGGRVARTDRVLDVACGTGYSTAILAGLAGEVLALEAEPTLRQQLQARLTGFGLDRVRTLNGPLGEGADSDGPFDVILVHGTVETGLDPLFSQLAEGGRLLTIQRSQNDRSGRATKAMRFEKSGGEVGGLVLFDASAPVLRAFKRAPAFVF